MNAERLLQHYEQIADAPDAIARLRRFILDLAVRGKLVWQDPTDEPAWELLKQIAGARTMAGIKAPPQILSTSDYPFPLPNGWLWSTVGSVTVKTGSGSTPRGGKEVYVEDGIPFLRSQNIYNDGLRLGDVAFIAPETHARMAGTAVTALDLLLNITGGSIGRCCIVPDTFVGANISQHVAIIRPALSKMAQFTHKLILSPYFQAFVVGEQTGAGRGGLPKKRMDQIAIPLPPLAEQHRIVAKVDELMALCDELEETRTERESKRDWLAAASLARLNTPDPETFPDDSRFALNALPALTARPDQIKQLRQTILNLAVRGKLVPQDPTDEPAAELLVKVAQEIAEYGKQNRVARTQVDPISDEDVPFSVPNGWRWARLSQLFNVITDGDHQPPPKADKGVAFLTIGNVTTGRLDFTGCRLVPEEYFNGLAPYRTPAKGDILYTVVGATYGRPALVESDRAFCVQRHIAILKPAKILNLQFLVSLLVSPLVYDQAARSTTGTAQPTIALRPLRNFLVPLPPLAEQHRIVTKVDELMGLCDQLEASLTSADEARRKLLDALLAEALAPVGAATLQEAAE